MKTLQKTVLLGHQSFVLPFRASGSWVNDAKSNGVMFCRSDEIAKELAKMLNERACNGLDQ